MSNLALKSTVTLLPSAVRTTTQTLSGRTNQNHSGGKWVLNVTAAPGAQTLTLNVFSETAAGNLALVGRITGIGTTGTWLLSIGPHQSGTTPTNSAVFPLPLPTRCTVQIVYSGGGAWSYTLCETLMP
jgi:hypothetical protein